MLGRERERGAIAGSQKVVLALTAAAPDRSYRVHHVTGTQAIAAGDLGGAGVAPSERAALRVQLRSGGPMDGTVDSAATEQRPVGGIDDRFHLERCDVGDADFETRLPDLGDQEGRGGRISNVSADPVPAQPERPLGQCRVPSGAA